LQYCCIAIAYTEAVKVAVANTKGGVGKTTSTVYLAAAAAAAGLSVDLIDLDKQGSLQGWFGSVVLPPGIRCISATTTALRHYGNADFTIVDTSPANQRELDAAAQFSDFTVIPTMPGQLNDDRAITTFHYLTTQHHRAAVLLCGVEERRVATRKSREAFEGKADLFDTVIPAREAIRLSVGNWPTREFFGYEKVVADLLEELNAH
jgi:chromosome partitioning protein